MKHEHNTYEYYTRVSLYLQFAILDFYVEVFENHFFGFCVPQSLVSLQHLSSSLIYVLKDRQFEVVFLQASFLLAVTQFVV